VQSDGAAAGKDMKVGTGRKGDEFFFPGRAKGSPCPAHHAQDRMFKDAALAVSHDHVREIVKGGHRY